MLAGGIVAAMADAPVEPRARVPSLAGWRGGLILAVLCLLAHVPGVFTIPPVDRDESRFAQASSQMAAGDSLHDWVVPMVGDAPRLNKPPVIYWLQAVSARLGGVADRERPEHTGGIGWYRLPSVLCAMIASLATWRIGISMFGPRHARTAWLAGAMLACSLMVMWDARQARADQLLLASTTLAMWALWRAWRSASAGRLPWGQVILLWLAIGLGVMSKGPITPMIAALTAAGVSAATERWRWLLRLRPLIGVLIVAACVAPWVVLVVRAVGWDEYWRIISDEVLGRSVSPSEGHWGPPGYHLVLLPLMFWPGSLLTAAGVVLAWKQSRRAAPPQFAAEGPGRFRRWLARFSDERPAELFLLAWLIPAWVVFELVNTKLPHYTMPLYPALALLSARAVMLASSDAMAATVMGLRALGARIGFGAWLVLGAAVTIGAPVALARLGGLEGGSSTRLMMGALVGMGAGCLVIAARALWLGQFARAQHFGLSAMVLAGAATFGVVLPSLHRPWISPRLARIIHGADHARTRPIAAVGYHEDSLKFLTSGRLDRLGWPSVKEWIASHPDGLLVVPVDGLEAKSQEAGVVLVPIGRTSGFNYSKGDEVDLVVVEPAR